MTETKKVNLPVPVDSIGHYLAEVNRFAVLSREEEEALALRYFETKDVEAAQRLVLSNLRFVVKVAFEYKAYGLRMADLIQEGNVGLLVAVKKFDPRKGVRLISYAVWWIRAYIQNYILRSWSLVKIGTTQAQRKLFYKLRESKRRLIAESGEGDYQGALDDEGAHEIAERLELHDDEVKAMDMRLMSRDVSLDAPLSDERSTSHLDLLCAPQNQEEEVAQHEETEHVGTQVQAALEHLNPREHYIVTHRLMADEPMTLQEIGTHFGISRERARQLEARAKKKLREALAEAA